MCLKLTSAIGRRISLLHSILKHVTQKEITFTAVGFFHSACVIVVFFAENTDTAHVLPERWPRTRPFPLVFGFIQSMITASASVDTWRDMRA